MDAESHPVILTFHSISEGGSPLRISPALFARQMEWLKANAVVLPLDRVATELAGARPLPRRAVALTFDDGFGDFAEQAAPVLRRLEFPATVFLPTAYCGRTNAWPGQPQWVEPQPLLDWDMIRELCRQGFSFGAHSRSHCVLTEVTPEQAEEEIKLSRRDIEEHVGVQADYFCYPYGLWNQRVREEVARHYRGACSTAAGVVEPDADPYALPRVDAHYLRRTAVFHLMFTERFRMYVTGRRWIRRLRGQPEGVYSRR